MLTSPARLLAASSFPSRRGSKVVVNVGVTVRRVVMSFSPGWVLSLERVAKAQGGLRRLASQHVGVNVKLALHGPEDADDKHDSQEAYQAEQSNEDP